VARALPALRHPQIFPLLLQRAAVTPGARRTREVVYAALREAGLARTTWCRWSACWSPPYSLRGERSRGRFAAHSPAQLDADFVRLQDILAAAVLAALARASRAV